MRFRQLALLSIGLGLVVAACGGDEGSGFTLASSNVERAEHPDVSSADASTLTAGNIAFATDLYEVLAKEDAGNIFFSPHSISTALAMTYAGARGQTEQEMATVLHFALPQDRLHAGFNALDRTLASRSTVKLPDKAKGDLHELRIANSTWGDRAYRFLPAYLDLLARNYGAGLRLVDFRGDAEGARATINRWVEERTQDRIKDLIPKGAVDETTRLVLANAIYFKASWAEPFDKALTAPGTFHRLDGSTVTTTMMTVRGADMRYGRVGAVQAIELPYVGEEVTMIVILPDPGTFAQAEASLSAASLQQIFDSLAAAGTTLTMPRFSFEWDASLVDPFMELGMRSAFEGEADFSGMDGTRNLAISDILHKSFIAVDEQGTEAAAATAVVIRETAAPRPVELILDRPFVFLIRDTKTGAILFFGRLVSPG